MRSAFLAGAFALAAVLAGCSGPQPVQDTPITATPGGAQHGAYRLAQHAAGFEHPIYAAQGPDGRIYVGEQAGRILAVQDDFSRATFLDIRDHVRDGGEQGLLGFAFDPHTPGRLVVHFTGNDGDTHLTEATFRPGTNNVQDTSGPATLGRTLLTVDDPFSNHNGGMVTFGPDGKLYLGIGDGGSGGDPQRRGQDLDSLLGKILRLEPDGRPAEGNPFVGQAGADEVWAYGLRNPWRFSFDREGGDLWVGDVGQNDWEEVDRVPFPQASGANFGWSAYEGTHRYNEDQEAPGHVPPVWEYENGVDGRCAVTGGYVYRGAALPALKGTYVYADYCNGKLWGLRLVDGAWTNALLLETGFKISSLGENAAGDLLVIDHGEPGRQGSVHYLTKA